LTVLRYSDIVLTMAKRRAESREGMVVTTVALPPELHRRLAVAALEEGAASAELIRDAIREWLDRRKRGKRGQ
jgi:metal-responsive CopG/Arc/MetJ family transcriptional regulator